MDLPHYQMLREMWTHEDHLLNHRITWLILAQALLVTAYAALVAGSGIAGLGNDERHQLARALQVLPWMSALLTGTLTIGLQAALSAMGDIERRYKKAIDEGMFDGEQCPLYPSRKHAVPARIAVYSIPVFFIVLWVALRFPIALS